MKTACGSFGSDFFMHKSPRTDHLTVLKDSSDVQVPPYEFTFQILTPKLERLVDGLVTIYLIE